MNLNLMIRASLCLVQNVGRLLLIKLRVLFQLWNVVIPQLLKATVIKLILFFIVVLLLNSLKVILFMKSQLSNHIGIARIRFHGEDGSFFWSLPIFYKDIIQLEDAIASAPNVPRGTVYDLQCIGWFDCDKGRLIPRKSRAYMAKDLRKLSAIIDKAAEAATPEPPKAAIETQCTNL